MPDFARFVSRHTLTNQHGCPRRGQRPVSPAAHIDPARAETRLQTHHVDTRLLAHALHQPIEGVRCEVLLLHRNHYGTVAEGGLFTANNGFVGREGRLYDGPAPLQFVNRPVNVVVGGG